MDGGKWVEVRGGCSGAISIRYTVCSECDACVAVEYPVALLGVDVSTQEWMKDRTIMTFGTLLRDLRKQHRLTQQQLADAVGVDFTYISKVENSRVDPPSETTIQKLAQVLDADPEMLLAQAGKLVPELKDAAAAEPQLALLLRTIGRKPLTPEQYRRMLDIAGENPTDVC